MWNFIRINQDKEMFCFSFLKESFIHLKIQKKKIIKIPEIKNLSFRRLFSLSLSIFIYWQTRVYTFKKKTEIICIFFCFDIFVEIDFCLFCNSIVPGDHSSTYIFLKKKHFLCVFRLFFFMLLYIISCSFIFSLCVFCGFPCVLK
jgi:hypothetical protein